MNKPMIFVLALVAAIILASMVFSSHGSKIRTKIPQDTANPSMPKDEGD